MPKTNPYQLVRVVENAKAFTFQYIGLIRDSASEDWDQTKHAKVRSPVFALADLPGATLRDDGVLEITPGTIAARYAVYSRKVIEDRASDSKGKSLSARFLERKQVWDLHLTGKWEKPREAGYKVDPDLAQAIANVMGTTVKAVIATIRDQDDPEDYCEKLAQNRKVVAEMQNLRENASRMELDSLLTEDEDESEDEAEEPTEE